MLLAASFLAFALALGAAAPTSTSTPVTTPTATSSPTRSSTLSPTPSVAPTPTATATLAPAPTATATHAPTATATATATAVPAATATPTPGPASRLPATQPGLSRYEGVFLVTDADDGSRAIYFVAQNSRHSMLESDLQAELRLNPLWPVQPVSREVALRYPEGAPVGAAAFGRLIAPPPATADDPSPPPDASLPTASAPAPVADEASAESSAAEATVYQVQPGDSLWHIAERFGTSPQAIQDANDLSNANRIYAGQQLVIPGAAAGQAPDPRADQVGAAPPPSDRPAAVAAANPASLTYAVRHGDTLIGIAARFGVDAADLQALNDLDNPNRIYTGQVLTLPTPA